MKPFYLIVLLPLSFLLAPISEDDDVGPIFSSVVQAEGYYQEARAYLAKGHYLPAEREFSRAIDLAPHFAQAYAERGALRCSIGKESEGAADFLRANRITELLSERPRFPRTCRGDSEQRIYENAPNTAYLMPAARMQFEG